MRQTGNFPQAFTHLSLINAAVNLDYNERTATMAPATTRGGPLELVTSIAIDRHIGTAPPVSDHLNLPQTCLLNLPT